MYLWMLALVLGTTLLAGSATLVTVAIKTRIDD
jgi:hypothetical protein